MNFSSVVNQDAAKQVLIRTAEKGQLPNSFLFSGPEGVGKWAMALALAAYLNCRAVKDGDSCGMCPSCAQMKQLQHPNLFIAIPTPPSKSEKEEHENYWELLNAKIAEPYSLITGEREMSIPINTVRNMRRSLAQKPGAAGMRVVLIEQMDRMRTSSADALLKLIEEPPPQTLIIITSSHPEKLLPTIISRCREISFGYLSEVSVRAYLSERSGESAAAVELLARLCHGSLGRALYLTSSDNAQDREVAKLLFKGFFVADAAELIAESADLLPFKDRSRINRVLSSWQSLFRDIIVIKNGGGRDEIVNIDFAAELERLAGHQMNLNDLLRLPARLSGSMKDIDLNVETQTAVGALIIDIKRLIG